MSGAAIQAEFIKLLTQQQKQLHGLCRLYYPVAEDRKDVFQEIVLQLWKAYPSFKGEANVRTWLYRIALNTIFSRLRKEKRQLKTEGLDASFEVIAQGAFSEEVQALYEAISQLEPVDRAITLLYLEEYSYQEIASLVAISKTNVSTRIHRIKAKLAKLLTLQLL